MSDATLRRWQQIMLVSLFLGYTGYYVCRTNLSVATPLLINAGLGLDKEAIGKISSYSIVFYAAGKFINGFLGDFLGGKRMFLLGMAASILCTILFGFGTTFAMFAMAWCLNRFVQSMGWGALVKMTSRWFGFDNYGKAMALLSLSFLIGNAGVKWYLGSLIEANLDWRQLFFASAATLAVVAIFCAFTLRPSPRDMGLPEPPVNPENLFGAEGEATRPDSLRELLATFLRSPIFWTILILSFGLTLIRETFNNWTPLYLTEAAGLSKGQAAKYSSIFDIAGGFSVLFCGFVTDRLFTGRRGGVMAVMLTLSIPALLGLALYKGNTSALPLTFVGLTAFLTIGPYSFLGGAIALDLGGKRASSAAAGMIDGVGYLGGIISGYTIANIAKTSGWGGAFGLLAGVSVLIAAAAVVYWFQESRARAAAQAARKGVGE